MSLSLCFSDTFKQNDIRKTISLETTLLDFRQFDGYYTVWWKYVYVCVCVCVCVWYEGHITRGYACRNRFCLQSCMLCLTHVVAGLGRTSGGELSVDRLLNKLAKSVEKDSWCDVRAQLQRKFGRLKDAFLAISKLPGAEKMPQHSELSISIHQLRTALLQLGSLSMSDTDRIVSVMCPTPLFELQQSCNRASTELQVSFSTLRRDRQTEIETDRQSVRQTGTESR